MEYRWNIGLIKKIILNSKIIYIASTDELSKKDSSLNVFQAETALSFLADVEFTPYSETTETAKFIEERRRKNLKDIATQNNILKTFKYNDSLEVHRIHQTGTPVPPSKTNE